MANRRGLGRGLEALIPNFDVEPEEMSEGGVGGVGRVVLLPVANIVPNRFQPRRDFNEEKLKELAESIKEHGVVQPVVVRKDGEKYEIVAGERRWRACLLLKMDTIPAIVKDIDNQELTEIALIENIQRQDLNALEEASAYQLLIKEFGYTQEDLAKRIGKSRSAVANTLRLLLLEKRVQEMLQEGELTAGHARALLALEGPAQVAAAEKVVGEELNVRQTEALVKGVLRKEAAAQEDAPEEEESGEEDSLYAILESVEESLRDALGTQVRIKSRNREKGRIEIEYYGYEELERIIDLILNS